MRPVKVPLAGKSGSVAINPAATEGAVFGVNLRNPDGTLVTAEQLAPAAAPISSSSTISVLYQDEGSDEGARGSVDTINFTGAGVTASLAGRVLTVNVSGGGGGAVRGMAVTESMAAVSTSNAIPLDSTVPQNTEGDEFTQLATSYTPTDAASILLIEVFLGMASNDTASNLILALFKDSDANAIRAVNVAPPAANYPVQMHLSARVVAGSTTARTYKARYGPNSNAMYVNRRQDNATIFNNIVASYMKITEIAP